MMRLPSPCFLDNQEVEKSEWSERLVHKRKECLKQILLGSRDGEVLEYRVSGSTYREAYMYTILYSQAHSFPSTGSPERLGPSTTIVQLDINVLMLCLHPSSHPWNLADGLLSPCFIVDLMVNPEGKLPAHVLLSFPILPFHSPLLAILDSNS